jgi:hypothetical protein
MQSYNALIIIKAGFVAMNIVMQVLVSKIAYYYWFSGDRTKAESSWVSIKAQTMAMTMYSFNYIKVKTWM